MSEAATLGAKIAKACLISDLTPADMIKGLRNGDYQQFAQGDSLIVTKIVSRPEGKACRIALAAGNAAEVWRIHDEDVLNWAKEQGCRFLIGRGRLGWRQEAEARGYREILRPRNSAGRELVEMTKDL